MKKLRLILITVIAFGAFISCQQEEGINSVNENSVNAITDITVDAPRHPYDEVYFSNWHERWYFSLNSCKRETNYHCMMALDGGIIVFPGEPFEVGPNPDPNPIPNIDLVEGSYTSFMKASFHESSVDIEIIKYSDGSMYDENQWVFTIEKDCYLKLGNSFSVGDKIESVLLMAGEYEIIPSTDGNSVGTFSVNAEVTLR